MRQPSSLMAKAQVAPLQALRESLRAQPGAPTSSIAKQFGHSAERGSVGRCGRVPSGTSRSLPPCVRGEGLRNLVVEEGESRGAEAKSVGGEVEAAADDSSLELSGPVAAVAEPGEDRLEIRKAVDVRRGGGRQLLEEAESARDRPKLAFLEELERTLGAPEVVGTGRQTLRPRVRSRRGRSGSTPGLR